MFVKRTDFELKLDLEQVLKGQGVDPARASARLVSIAEEALAEARELVKPAALYGTVPVRGFEHRRVDFAGGSFEGELVARAAAGARELTFVLCTIGPELEERVARLMSANMLKAVALDGAGVAALSELSDSVLKIVTAAVEARGFKAGMRISPGQEGWPLEQQQVFFHIVPAAEIGVRLTDSCLMLPRKSVSFVVPAGESMDSDAVPCDFCSKRERCRWRREKTVSGHYPPRGGGGYKKMLGRG